MWCSTCPGPNGTKVAKNVTSHEESKHHVTYSFASTKKCSVAASDAGTVMVLVQRLFLMLPVFLGSRLQRPGVKAPEVVEDRPRVEATEVGVQCDFHRMEDAGPQRRVKGASRPKAGSAGPPGS